MTFGRFCVFGKFVLAMWVRVDVCFDWGRLRRFFRSIKGAKLSAVSKQVVYQMCLVVAVFRRRKGGPLARKLWVDCGIVIYCWSKHGVYPKPLPVRLRSCLARRVASYVQKFCRSEPAEAR